MNTYRLLQKHLNRQPVGFPAVRSGADLRFLKRVFAPEEAKLALYLSYRPAATQAVIDRAAPEFTSEKVEELLNAMFMKGSIARKEKNGAPHWYLMPLVVGIYESQGGRPSIAFAKDAAAYMQTFAYGKSLLAVNPPQMRTIPVNKSIEVERHVASYNQVEAIVNEAEPPFLVLECICRINEKLRRKPCKRTKRGETCMAFGQMAAMAVKRGHGREITREEALEILHENEREGLVFQPSGVQKPEFICSCCGCCCGMLGLQKKLPHPVDFWTSSFCAEVNEDACTGCGKCVQRCQVDAVKLTGSDGSAGINLSRCIGCGLCVTTCPSKALRLVEKEEEPVLPENEEDLSETIMKNKKSALGEWAMMVKIVLGMRQ